jgi:hypothetical protein
MRALRVLSLLAAVATLAAGCARHDAGTASRAPSAPAHVLAPKNPDFSPVVERYYQLVEGQHWSVAYAMLSDRYRAQHPQAAFEALYEGTSNADVHARQTGERSVVTSLAIQATGAQAAHTLHETLTFGWDGERWAIDDIVRSAAAR